MNARQEAEFFEHAEVIARHRARQKLLSFIKYTKSDYDVNWHHRLMCRKLDQWYEKKIRRLMLLMPPRNGKSEGASRRLPAYILGRNPNAQIISASYGGSLAVAMSRDVQRIMDSPEYAELFPDTVLPTAADRSGYSRQSNAFEIIGHRGSYRSVGIGGGITGRGADYLIIDDPIKNDKEADSITYRESNWEWYGSTAYTRLEKDACVLVIMTQWHEDDLAGRLERQMRDDPDADQWEVLRLPAILETLEGKHPEDPREIGQALWPRKYDEQKLKSMKATIGSRFWNALFQQRPSALAGNVIKREWLQNRYKALPDRFDEIIQSWDCSFEGNDTSDYVVGQVWGRVAAKFFLIDQIRERLGYTDTKAMIKSVSAKYPKSFRKIIERKANGHAVINELKEDIIGIVPFEPDSSKLSRLRSVESLFEAGNVWLPDPSRAQWMHDYVEELVNFPNGAHDDQVDCTSQALIHMRENGDWLKQLNNW